MPEIVKFYSVETDTETMESLKKVNGIFINGSKTTDEVGSILNDLNNRITSSPEYCYGGNPENYSVWKDRVVKLPIENAQFDLIIETGIFL